MLGQTDARDRELARILVNYSTKAKKGELAFIHCVGRDTLGLGAACAEEAIRAGAAPYIQFTDPEVNRRIVRAAGEGVFRRLGRFELKQMKDADIYIGIRGADNSFEMSDTPRAQLNLYNKHIVKPVHLEERVKRTRWVVLRYPNSAMAQMAQTSTEAFAEFFYRVCCVDYARMLKAAQPLKALMQKTDRVHITGPGTDLRLSIRGIGVVPCCGDCNIPDGECFTAPVRNSVEGTVQFNTPTLWEGAAYENVFPALREGPRGGGAGGERGPDAAAQPCAGPGSRRAVRGRVLAGVQPACAGADARHPVRREDCGQLPHGAGAVLRRRVQRQQVGGALGPGVHPEARARRRRDTV